VTTSLAAVDGQYDDDIMSVAFQKDPFPLYNRIREETPVYWCEPWNAWLVTRYDDVVAVLRDWERFSSEGRHEAFTSELDKESSETAAHAIATMLDLDPPDHTRLRRLSSGAFAPRRVEELRPTLEQDCRDLLSSVEPGSSFDYITTVARPLPAISIARMMGLPLEDAETYLRWVDGVITYWSTTPPTDETATLIGRVMDETNTYFTDYIRRVRDNPPDTVVGELIKAQEAGDRLSYEELITYCSMLLNAASDTSRSLIGNQTVPVLEDPDLQARVRADRTLIPKVVEEAMRYSSPLLRAPRLVNEDVQLAGRTLRKGTLAFAIFASANRDPRIFEHPDDFDIDRPSNDKQIGFGSGRHLCIGAAIARMQAEVALATLLDTFDEIALDEVEWRPLHLIRSPGRLMINVR
jgi:cytochrome P450